MEYDIIIDGITRQVSGYCKEWCLDQHYTFFHNEHVMSLWILIVPFFLLLFNWAITSVKEDDPALTQLQVSTGIDREKLYKIAHITIPISMLSIILYILYILFWVVK